MTFEGTDCRLAEVGRLADTTGGRVRYTSGSQPRVRGPHKGSLDYTKGSRDDKTG